MTKQITQKTALKLLEALKMILEVDMDGMTEKEIAEIEEDSLYGICLNAIARAESEM